MYLDLFGGPLFIEPAIWNLISGVYLNQKVAYEQPLLPVHHGLREGMPQDMGMQTGVLTNAHMLCMLYGSFPK